MLLMVCWEYPWSEMGLDECLGGKFVDVISDLKNSDVIVEVGTIIVGVVDNPLGRNPTAWRSWWRWWTWWCLPTRQVWQTEHERLTALVGHPVAPVVLSNHHLHLAQYWCHACLSLMTFEPFAFKKNTCDQFYIDKSLHLWCGQCSEQQWWCTVIIVIMPPLWM